MPPEKRRQQLLAAAKKLFTKKGYRGTTTEEIARRARLTKGALYHHFKSKEEILMALVHDMHCRYDEIMVRASQGDASPLTLLTELLNVHQREDMSDLRNMIDLRIQAMRIPAIKRHMDNLAAAAISEFAASLDPKYGADLKTREQLVILVLSLYNGLAFRKNMKPSTVDIPMQLLLFEKFQNGLVNSNTGKRKRGSDKTM